VNQLRQLMLEELRRRNFADTTVRCYPARRYAFQPLLSSSTRSTRSGGIGKYQAMLFTRLKYSPNTVILRLAALRFFLHSRVEAWLEHRRDALPKKVRHLPGYSVRKKSRD